MILKSFAQGFVFSRPESVYDGRLDQLHQKYAKNKLIQANLKNASEVEKLKTNFPIELGELHFTNDLASIIAPREKTMEAAKYLLNNSNVLDLNIKEEEIGNIIEKIMKIKGDL